MVMLNTKAKPFSLFTDYDIFLFKQGKHFSLYEKFGSHCVCHEGQEGVYFSVWAPNAKAVHVIGDFNNWNHSSHPMFARWDSSGIWECFIPHLKSGTLYKYFIHSHMGNKEIEKGDPFAFLWEIPPKTASVVWDLDFDWKHSKKSSKPSESYKKPMSTYEIHIGSWKKKSFHESYSFLELASELPKYLCEMGFTHVEFMPVMEHPFFGSWGYQKTGYFAPSSRFGTPQDFMTLIDALHACGIRIILDWVPSHFPSDPHSLINFDGTSLFEHEDPKLGFHPDWKSSIFNYSRLEVASFLISSAAFWCDIYNVDGLRVDAVSSMLYLDYSRKPGEWYPNIFGGNENLESIQFLKDLNEHLYNRFPNIDLIAEESTAWPMVSRPTTCSGLGFGFKWNMGWMHDTLHYFSKDPIYRKYDHPRLLFSMCYYYTENFILSLSHDEVVYGKGSLINKMPGNLWQKFANLRLLFSYLYTHPGKKLLFMGAEIAQWNEWNHDGCLQWDLLQFSSHQGIQELVKDLNTLHKTCPALYELDHDPEGFQWVHLHDSDNSVIAFLRKSSNPLEILLILCNFTPVVREKYEIDKFSDDTWLLIFNSDDLKYDGSLYPVKEILDPKSSPFSSKLEVTLAPLATLIYKKSSL